MVYWRLKSVPELRDLPVGVQRHLCRKLAKGPLRFGDLLWVLLFVLTAAPFCWFVNRVEPTPRPWAEGCLWIGLYFWTQIAFRLVSIARARFMLRRLIAAGEALHSDPEEEQPARRQTLGLWVGGIVFWIFAAPMLLGHYLDMKSQTAPGLVFGTLFVGTGIVFFFSAARISLREHQKRERQLTGLCPNCGYDLRASPDRCPECGF